MKDQNENKGKRPDYKVHLVQENKKGEEQWTDVGAGWNGRKGYINLETMAGKVVLTPRAELERMRTEKGHNNNRTPKPEIDPKP